MFFGTFVALRIGKRYDYIFGFDIAALTSMVPAILIKKVYKKKVTLWIQDVWPDSVYAYGFKKTRLLSFFLNGFVKFIYKNSSNFAVSGQGFIEKVKTYSIDKKIEYLPNWADDFNKDLEPFMFSKEEKIHFTFAGNVGKVQNLDNIIQAFSLLSEELLSKSQFNIIGDGSHLEHLKIVVEKYNLSNIVFWGRKPRDEMYKYFQASDFLLVSLIDKPIFSLTVPAKVQTYIAANKPILAIVNGDAADIIRKNNLGYTARPSDINDISDVLIKAINTDSQTSQLFTKNCENLTNTTFNKCKIINSLLTLLIR